MPAHVGGRTPSGSAATGSVRKPNGSEPWPDAANARRNDADQRLPLTYSASTRGAAAGPPGTMTPLENSDTSSGNAATGGGVMPAGRALAVARTVAPGAG